MRGGFSKPDSVNTVPEHTTGPQASGNQAVQRLFHAGAIQAKLAVSQPGDPYEQEADRVAQQVVSMLAPSSVVSGQSSVQRQTSKKDEMVQTKPLAFTITPLVQRATLDTGGNFEPGADLEARLGSSSGSTLPDSTRAFMEPRFGVDLSGVRLHTGSEAAQLNRAVSAQAFTHGRDIYLGEGKNNLESSAGKQLLAHELTHTIQQGANRSLDLAVQRAPLPGVGGGLIQRDGDREGLLTAYNEALSRSDWNEVAVRLNGFNDADIKSLVGKYSKATLIAVKDAALTVMPGWNARVVRPVNARLAALMGSDQVLHASAKEIQDYLLHSPFLKAYVSSKFSGGNPLEGHIHIDDDAAFRTACIAYTMRQGKTREEAEVIESQQSAFREGDDIHVRKDDGKFTTTIHESMHRFSSPAYQRGLSNNANEGAAEYFTRIICKDQTLIFRASYPNQLNSTDLLVGASSKETVADAFFSGALPALLTAVDTAKGAGSLRRWSEFMNAGSYAQADALLK